MSAPPLNELFDQILVYFTELFKKIDLDNPMHFLVFFIAITFSVPVVYSIIITIRERNKGKMEEVFPKNKTTFTKSEVSKSNNINEAWYSTAEKQEYYRGLTVQDVLDLRRFGVEAYRAPRDWVIPKSLDHLPKEVVWKMLRKSFWTIHWPYYVRKAFEWLYKTNGS